MVYISEAVLPADLKFGAPRLIFKNIAEAEATRLEDVDILEEERSNTVIQSARYQQTLRRRAIMIRSYGIDPLQWEILSSAKFWRGRDGTNCRHYGKDHS
jgi:hypothetical protein